MNFFDHKDLGNHLLQECPQVVKHPVYVFSHLNIGHLHVSISEASYLYLHFPQNKALHIMVFISAVKFKNTTLMLNTRLL